MLPPERALSSSREPSSPVDRVLDEMFPLVYDELRRLASRVRAGRASETWDATALVHEAYLKMSRSKHLAVTDRAHFMRIAARAMRQVLVDRAETAATAKRGGRAPDITLSDSLAGDKALDPGELLDLNEALGSLAEEQPRAAQVVECRFFAGMNADDTAIALGISVPTVTRDWRFARAWLTSRLST
jgi:RNA polymerase sigma factor (TIGR02999 family)